MRKKSPTKSLKHIKDEIVAIRNFVQEAKDKAMSDVAQDSCYEFAIIWAYKEFEQFILNILVAQINRDPSRFYKAIGVIFDKHPTVDQCKYLLTGDRYFDFRGHGGLVQLIRKAAGVGSLLEIAAKDKEGRVAFEILVGLRNYVAHESDQSRQAALTAMRHWEPDRQNLGSAGYWLSVAIRGQTRLERLFANVEELCEEMTKAV
ncbi:MAG: hypothetical protein WA418_33620 [Bradyrhizobium sp.]